MKTMFKFAALALVLVAGVYAARSYSTPESAALNCPEVQYCLNQGYAMTACTTNPIYYFVPPTGTYNWGCVDVVMTAKNSPNVMVCVTIEATDRGGRMIFREASHTVQTPY